MAAEVQVAFTGLESRRGWKLLELTQLLRDPRSLPIDISEHGFEWPGNRRADDNSTIRIDRDGEVAAWLTNQRVADLAISPARLQLKRLAPFFHPAPKTRLCTGPGHLVR